MLKLEVAGLNRLIVLYVANKKMRPGSDVPIWKDTAGFGEHEPKQLNRMS